jgi:hypothetical protein
MGRSERREREKQEKSPALRFYEKGREEVLPTPFEGPMLLKQKAFLVLRCMRSFSSLCNRYSGKGKKKAREKSENEGS